MAKFVFKPLSLNKKMFNTKVKKSINNLFLVKEKKEVINFLINKN